MGLTLDLPQMYELYGRRFCLVSNHQHLGALRNSFMKAPINYKFRVGRKETIPMAENCERGKPIEVVRPCKLLAIAVVLSNERPIVRQ